MYKTNIICVTLTNGWENYKRKYITELQRQNSRRFNYYHWMNFRWIFFKTVASMKKWSTRESCVFTVDFHQHITCSIPVSVPVSGWRATSKKDTWKTKWSSSRHAEKFNSSRGAFSKNLFRDKDRTRDLAVFEITWKRLGIRENHQHEKFRIFLSFSMVYYLPHSDKVCRNYSENTFLAIFKIDLKQ